MKVINKKIAVTLIILWLARPVIFWIFNLEFADAEIQGKYKFAWSILLPFALLLLLVPEMRNMDTLGKKVAHVIASLFVLGATFSILFLFSLGVCHYVEIGQLYKHKIENSVVISRYYDCGAYDSDPRKIETVKVHALNPWLNVVDDFDSDDFNEENWTMIEGSHH